MHDKSVNPYEVVPVSEEPLDDDATEVSFHLTRSLLRHSEDHYLLHQHPFRLLFSSLAMIFISGAALVWSSQRGVLIYFATCVAALAVSSGIYLALVHRTKVKARRRMAQLGAFPNTSCTVATRDADLVMTNSAGEHRWPKEQLKVYRTPRGTLICPEPLVFVYVPRRNNSPREAYAALREKLKPSDK